MGKLIATDAFWWVNGLDLSNYGTQVSPNYGSETQDITTFGQGTRIVKGGLKTWSFDVTFLFDNTTGGPEAGLWSLVGTTSCVEYRPVNACSTVINPSYSGIGTLETLPQSVQVGNRIEMTARWVASGALSRASSS